MSKEDKAFEYAKMRYGNNGNETQNEMAKMIACRVGYEAGWDEALKSQFRKCVNNKPIEGQEPNDGENVILLCQMLCGGLEGNIFPMDNAFKNGDWEVKMLTHYRIIAWMPIPSFDKILEDNKDVLKRLKG